MCSCGWRSGEISGDRATGPEDDASRKLVYNRWNEHDVPGFQEQDRGDDR